MVSSLTGVMSVPSSLCLLTAVARGHPYQSQGRAPPHLPLLFARPFPGHKVLLHRPLSIDSKGRRSGLAGMYVFKSFLIRSGLLGRTRIQANCNFLHVTRFTIKPLTAFPYTNGTIEQSQRITFCFIYSCKQPAPHIQERFQARAGCNVRIMLASRQLPEMPQPPVTWPEIPPGTDRGGVRCMVSTRVPALTTPSVSETPHCGSISVIDNIPIYLKRPRTSAGL